MYELECSVGKKIIRNFNYEYAQHHMMIDHAEIRIEEAHSPRANKICFVMIKKIVDCFQPVFLQFKLHWDVFYVLSNEFDYWWFSVLTSIRTLFKISTKMVSKRSFGNRSRRKLCLTILPSNLFVEFIFAHLEYIRLLYLKSIKQLKWIGRQFSSFEANNQKARELVHISNSNCPEHILRIN